MRRSCHIRSVEIGAEPRNCRQTWIVCYCCLFFNYDRVLHFRAPLAIKVPSLKKDEALRVICPEFDCS